MIILGIDTSCDDTSVALIEIRNSKTEPRNYGAKVKMRTKFSSPFEIRSNIVSSQVKIHAKYGGVYPFLAKREHQKNLPVVFKRALRQAQGKQKFEKPNLIAVTVGPGLEPCLWVGVSFIKDLAKNLKLSIIPVNHIEAHIIANWLSPIRSKSPPTKIFGGGPAICLVVSGGHTQLILMKNFGNYKILGETRDDAAGECFDKVARILGLPYPGGPAIAAQAAQWKSNIQYPISNIQLPRPMIYQKNYDFSFSGLKTAVLYDFKNRPSKVRKSKIYIQEMAKEVQQAIIDVLIYKTLKAAKNFKAKSIILGGGVASNEELREQFKEKIQKELPNIQYLIPNIQFCTDNAAMVAVAGYFHWLKGEKYNLEKIKANANLRLG